MMRAMEPESPPGAGGIPLSIRILAFILVAWGTASIIAMAAAPFFDRFVLDFNFLLIPLALGLLKRSDGARILSLVLAWMVLAAGGLLAIFAIIFPDRGALTLVHTRIPIPGLLAMASGILFAGIGCALVTALRRSKRAGWFLPPGVSRPEIDAGTRKRLWRAAAAGALLSLGVAILAAAIPPPLDTGCTRGGEGGVLSSVHYGTRLGRLAYVVFQRGRSLPGIHPGRSGRAVLHRDGEPDLEFPAETQLHEIIDGRYRTIDRTVTLEQFRRFLSEDPGEHTIDALLRSAGGG